MVDKLLFYSNEWEDFSFFIRSVSALEKEGYEVAVATDNSDFIRPLAMGKLLMVNPKTYRYSVVVTDNKTFTKNSMSIKDFKEVFE